MEIWSSGVGTSVRRVPVGPQPVTRATANPQQMACFIKSSPSRQGRGGSTLFREIEFLRVPFGNEFPCCVGATIEDTTGMEKLHPAQRGRVRVGLSVGAGQLRPERSVLCVLCQSRVGIGSHS